MSADIDWIAQARTTCLDGRALISGQRELTGGTRTLLSPRTGAALVEVATADEADVERVLSAATVAAESWAKTPPAVRGEILHAWADAVQAHRAELALLLALEVGKPVRAAYDVETRSLVRTLRWYAETADKCLGAHPDTGPSSVALVAREPVGVVAVVLPWNFPLSMVGYDVAPALAAGNAVVVKPSPQAPLAVLRACELAVEAGLPPDALAVLPDDGTTVGAALARHPLIDVVSVTGGEAAGRAYLRYAAEGVPKRVWPKLGGKSYVAVAADTPNLERAADAITWGAFFNQGAMCTGAARILVERPVYADFTGLLLDRIRALITGDPLRWPTDVGALAGDYLLEATQHAVRLALAGGGRCLTGTGDLEPVPGLGGRYVRPVLLADLPPEHPIHTEEIFGPVAAVAPVASIDDVAKSANASRYGIAFSLWTGSLKTAFRISKTVKAGTVWVNCFEGDDLSVPFGGVRRSGYGRDKSLAAIDKYTDLKTTWIQLDEQPSW